MANFFHALFVDPSKRISIMGHVVREIIHQKRLSFNLESWQGNEEKGKT